MDNEMLKIILELLETGDHKSNNQSKRIELLNQRITKISEVLEIQNTINKFLLESIEKLNNSKNT